MAVLFDREAIGSGYNVSKINSNFEKIQEALADAVSTSGTAPNSMEADFDLNSNDLLNGGVGNFQNIFVDGTPINEVVGIRGETGPQGPQGRDATGMTSRLYSAVPGSGLTYTLPYEPYNNAALDIIIGGVPQPKTGAYTWSGTTLTLSEDPGTDLVEMIVLQPVAVGAVPLGSIGADEIDAADIDAIRTKLKISVSTPQMFGYTGLSLAADTIALQSAIDTGYCDLGTTSYTVSDVALSGIIYSAGATINISGHTSSLTDPLMYGSIVGELTITGTTPTTVTVSSAALADSGTFSVEYYTSDIRSAKYQVVNLTLVSATGVSIGDMLLFTADQKELSGCYEVIAKASNVVTVLMLAQGSLSLATCTGTAKVLTTVRQFTNITPITLESGSLILNNIGIIGACYPTTNGSRGNVYDPSGGNSGVSGIIARRSAFIEGNDCGINGISGTQVAAVDTATIDWTSSFASCGGRNGLSAASTSKGIYGSSVASQNLLDGIIWQDVSFVFATSAVAAHNGRNGFIGSGGANATVSSSFSYDNGGLDTSNGNGLSLSSARATAISFTAKRNTSAGIRGIGHSSVRATSATLTNNDYGAYADTNSQITINGTVNTNTTTDLVAANGSYVSAISTTFTSSSPTAGKRDGTGAIIQTTSTIPDLATSNGINVGGGGVIKRIVRLRVVADFTSVAAQGEQTINVSVPGVVVADDSVVKVSYDFTGPRVGLIFEGYVSANDQVTLRAVNFTAAAIDPPSLPFNVEVVQF